MRMKRPAFAFGIALACASAMPQDPGVKQFAPEQIKRGADIFARNCATCHGTRM